MKKILLEAKYAVFAYLGGAAALIGANINTGNKWYLAGAVVCLVMTGLSVYWTNKK